MTHLVESVLTAILVHLLPWLLLKDGGGGGHLGDDAESILLHVLHHGGEVAGLRLGAERADVPENLLVARISIPPRARDKVSYVEMPEGDEYQPPETLAMDTKRILALR